MLRELASASSFSFLASSSVNLVQQSRIDKTISIQNSLSIKSVKPLGSYRLLPGPPELSAQAFLVGGIARSFMLSLTTSNKRFLIVSLYSLTVSMAIIGLYRYVLNSKLLLTGDDLDVSREMQIIPLILFLLLIRYNLIVMTSFLQFSK